jgi:hypothetical protein
MNNLTKESDWLQWKEKCAFKLCDEETRERLGKFGNLRFEKYIMGTKTHGLAAKELQSLLNSIKLDEHRVPNLTQFAENVWQQLDTLVVLKKKTSKSLKDWLVQNVGSLEAMESEASYQFRDAVREFIKIERGKTGWRTNDSLQRKVSDTDLTIGDMMESNSRTPSQTAILNEFKNSIGDFFKGLSKEIKIAFLAKALGISLDNPLVKELAQKGKSQLSENWKQKIDFLVNKFHCDETFCMVEEEILFENIMTEIEKISIDWGKKPENGCTELLKVSDE